ncbi:MAG: division/cell wall cluster transcriptional repressor MraZ [Candidatus Levybacteria bacterium]|nr:division/cell wall cluster transcriptional repressor MraZ [Candidatus Levybacteria bacterium]
MVLGQYEGKIDEKSRVSFPKRFREFLGERLVVTKGLDENLIIVSAAEWETLLEGSSEISFLNRDAREMQRFLLGNAEYVQLDEKGRILLPLSLKTYAKLQATVVFAGMKRYVELWDKRLWDKEQDRLAKSIPSVAERLSEREKHGA